MSGKNELEKDLVECLGIVGSEISALYKEIAFCRQHDMVFIFKKERLDGMLDVYNKILNDVMGRHFLRSGAYPAGRRNRKGA